MMGRGKAYIGFLAGFAIILAGFWPTFFGDPRSNDVWHTLHGTLSTLWVLLLIAQSLLVGRGRIALHRRLGWASLALFAALFASSGYMVWVETVGDPDFPRALRLLLIFLDIGFLALFLFVYALGIAFRRDRRVHARLMGSTILIGLGPAMGRLYAERIPAMHGLAGGLRWTFWTLEAVLAVAILLDWQQKRPFWPFALMLAAFVALQIGSGWATGPTFAGWVRAAGAPV